MLLKDDKKIYTKFEYWFYLILLLGIATLYYCLFERAVIPPQTGWWQYMAWRMTEGDLPYKDFFLYVPPYFAILTDFLYQFFHNNFILYTIIGFLFTRVLTWVLIYNILIKIFKPVTVAFGMIVGICITSSYLADQCYDYNPLILMLTVLSAYIIQQLSLNNSNKRNYFGCFALGMICGVQLFLKQNVGIVIPIIFVFCILLLGGIYKYKVKQTIINISLLIIGNLTTIIPGIAYLIKNDIWNDFWDCVIKAVGAKTSNSNFISVALENFLNLDALLIAVMIILAIVVVKSNLLENYRCITSLVFVGLLLSFITIFEQNIRGFISGLSIRNNIILILAFIISLGILKKFYDILSKNVRYIHLFYLTLWVLFIVTMYIVTNLSTIHAEWLYYGIDFSTLKSGLLYIVLYCVILLWFYMIYQIFYLKQYTYFPFLFPSIIFLLFMGVSFVSARLEELYAVLIVPVFICVLIQNIAPKFQIKNLIVYASCFSICLLCLTEKLFIPYDWHGWSMESILPSENEVRSINVDGLDGFKIADSDANSYEMIVNSILSNSDENDVLYQFPNLLLFNVLTERKSIYTPVPYFDVCPDELAVESAEYLEKNSPELVLFSELSQSRWEIHEQYFRNGNLSGQRKIQEFYDNIVKENYRQLGYYENRSGDPLCLWKNTAYSSGAAKSTQQVADNFEITKEISFNKREFDTFCIYASDNLIDQSVQLKIVDETDNKTIYDKDVTFSSKEMDYYEANLGSVFVDTEHTYMVEITTNFNMQNGQIQLGATTEENSNNSSVANKICFTFD